MKFVWLLRGKKNFRALALIVCTLCYLIIGAAAFYFFESESDNQKRYVLSELSGRLREKYNFTDDDFQVLQTVIIRSIPHKAGYQWKFVGAFYFATVVITTIGYGHSTPNTKLGKMFCIIYALCGVPLNLVMFQCIGERLNTFIAYALYVIKSTFRLRHFRATHSHVILVSMSMGAVIIILGAYMFHKYENWSFFDSFYYCFITLSTIGFGDYVAIQKNYALERNYEYIVLSLLFIAFGLALFSASVNLFVLRFMASKADLKKWSNHPLLPILPDRRNSRAFRKAVGAHMAGGQSPITSLTYAIAPTHCAQRSLDQATCKQHTQSQIAFQRNHYYAYNAQDVWQRRS